MKQPALFLSFKVLIFAFSFLSCPAQIALRYEEGYSLNYDEIIQAYTELDKDYKEASLLQAGPTDVGKSMHIFVISTGGSFDPAVIKSENKRIIFILNGIHPGESCGIDASIKFAREVLDKKSDLYAYLENTVLCIIPVYNVGGVLNRSLYHRANQEEAVEGGFRGNARNLDLNRDCIKLDSRNAQSFTRIFRHWDPDVFLDTHVTNGSDHQYTITLLHDILQRLDPGIRDFMELEMLPGLYSGMKETPYEMCPYVNLYKQSPREGIKPDLGSPRYTEVYTGLFNTLSVLTEVHLYKAFPDQVKSTYHFLKVLLAFTSQHAGEIGKVRENAIAETCQLKEYTIQWELDTSRWEMFLFKGYAFKSRTSELTGLTRNYYDREDPWEEEIPFYNYYRQVETIKVPEYFIIPQAWSEVIDRLELNRIEMFPLPADTVIGVEAFYIEDITYAKKPYNGHFIHENISVRSENQDIQFFQGDLLIPLNQPGNRYLMETLDPRCTDSFMRWNFFDPILDRRAYFSPSDFEKNALEILESDPGLKFRFEKEKAEDPEFAGSDYAQLSYIYTQSAYAEKSYQRCPVYRLLSNDNRSK